VKASIQLLLVGLLVGAIGIVLPQMISANERAPGTKPRIAVFSGPTSTIQKTGILPFAKDPRRPTATERRAIQAVIDQYQEVFFSH